jgi:NADPH2:quinone reductase
LSSLWLMQNSIAIRFFMIYDISQADRAAGLAELDALLRAGQLRHTVGLRLPLAGVSRAHDVVEQGSVMGGVVLDIA